jgi:hypothetical protein
MGILIHKEDEGAAAPVKAFVSSTEGCSKTG